jgi:hypothetical protein
LSTQVGLLPPQTLDEALADLARHPAVGGWKELATRINPKLADEPTEAGKWLSRALAPNRREAFLEQHWRRAVELGVSIGCDVCWQFYCEATGHKYSEPAQTKSRKLQLLEERERIASRDRQIQQELDEISAGENVTQLDRRL